MPARQTTTKSAAASRAFITTPAEITAKRALIGLLANEPRVVLILLPGRAEVLLAGHFDISAHWHDVDPIVGLPPLEAEQPRPETEGELIDPDSDGFGNGEMTELVNEYDQPQSEQETAKSAITIQPTDQPN